MVKIKKTANIINKLWAIRFHTLEEVKQGLEEWPKEQIIELLFQSAKAWGNLTDCGQKSFSFKPEIANANEMMADVLKENGFKPFHLLIEYKVIECESCEANVELTGDSLKCNSRYISGDCPYHRAIQTFSFWTFSVEEDYLRGLTSAFVDTELRVIKIFDITNPNRKVMLYQADEYELEGCEEDDNEQTI